FWPTPVHGFASAHAPWTAAAQNLLRLACREAATRAASSDALPYPFPFARYRCYQARITRSDHRDIKAFRPTGSCSLYVIGHLASSSDAGPWSLDHLDEASYINAARAFLP